MTNHHRDRAIRLMREEKYSEAIPMFRGLIKEDPLDWSLFYMIGQCCRFKPDIPQSIHYLRKAANLNQQEPQIFLALGIALQLDKKFHDAIDNLKYAVKLEPNLVTAYNSIGLTYRKLSNYSEAIKWYMGASENHINSLVDQIHQDKDKCYREEIIDGKKTRVVLPYVNEKIQEELRSEPTHSIIMNNIGSCYIELGDINAARECFQESIEFIPDGFNYPDPFKNLESIQ